MYTILKQGYENVVEQCNDIVVECTNDLEKSKPDSEKLQKSLQKLENKYEVQANKLDSTIKQHCETKEKLGKYNTKKKLKNRNLKSNENAQLLEEIGEREEYIMNTNILSMTNDLEKIKNENEELWDNIFEKEADRQSLQEKTNVLSKQKLDLQKKFLSLIKNLKKSNRNKSQFSSKKKLK